MSNMSNEAIQSQIEANRLAGALIVEGDAVTNATADSMLYSDGSSNIASGAAMTASKPLYSDASQVPTTGAFPFEVEITGSTDTTFSFLDLTGQSSDSADVLMQGTIVNGSSVTTFI